jgi:hypothetical protein
MPAEDPNLATVAMSAAGGLVGGGWVALSRPMARREVFFCLVGGVGIGAFLPPLIVAYWGLPQIAAAGIGFIGGVSVFGVFSGLQALTGKWMTKVTNDISRDEPKREAQ